MGKKAKSTDREIEFLKYYLDQTGEEMRHIETLRARVAIATFTVSFVTAGFISQQKFPPENKALSAAIMFCGFFGLIAIYKLYSIHQKDQNRQDKWRGVSIIRPEARLNRA